MKDYSKDFGAFNGKVWLNSASEGAIPRVAVEAAQEAIEWKQAPYEMTLKRFSEVPKELKKAFGKMLNVNPLDIILANSASYGIHLFANGFPFESGDEVLVMQNDFPVDIIPWLHLEKKGVSVKQVKAAANVLTPEEVKENITQRTKIVCLPSVHTFSGHVTDIVAIGEICKNEDIVFIVNLSQSLGNTPIDLSKLPIDAITSSAFKWLLGPYGTGVCWIKPELRQRLEYNNVAWGAVLSEEQLQSEDVLKLGEITSARKFDVFGTANFFNFKPLIASVEYLLNIGVDHVQAHIQELVEQIIQGLTDLDYQLISPQAAGGRSALVVFSHADRSKNKTIYSHLLEQGVYLALWKGNLRASPHIFNTKDEIKIFLSALKAF